MPNAFAYLSLFAAVPFGIALFAMLRAPLAAITIYLLFAMFLPELTELDLPALPGLGKEEIAGLTCLFGLLLKARGKVARAKPLRGPDLWLTLWMIGAFGTVFTNGDPLIYGKVVLPGLTLHEGISMVLSDILRYVAPFLTARALFTSTRDIKLMLSAIAVAAAAYTPFVFIELMMSPQLHNWIYGFHQHDFVQTMRGGGYRPMVFMEHGLCVALFLVFGVLAATTLVKAKRRVAGLPAAFFAPYVLGFLIASKSLGAAIYALAIAPLMIFTKPRTILRLSMVLAALVFLYPALRAVDVFPAEGIVKAAESVASERAADSMGYRFRMEHMLSEHASERMLFGWGRFRRNMVFQAETGRELSVSDGHWVIVYGVRGAWGFVCFFALLLGPIWTLHRRYRLLQTNEDRWLLCGLAAIVSVATVDLLPNGLFNNLVVFFAGALAGGTKGMTSTVLSPHAVVAEIDLSARVEVPPQPAATGAPQQQRPTASSSASSGGRSATDGAYRPQDGGPSGTRRS